MTTSSNLRSSSNTLTKRLLVISGLGATFCFSFVLFSYFIFPNSQETTELPQNSSQPKERLIDSSNGQVSPSLNVVQNGELVSPTAPRSYPPVSLIYNVETPPSLKLDSELQYIVERIRQTVQSQGLPLDKLSISLIELNKESCCQYAAYQDQVSRFPASVAKLFWLVAFFSQYDQGRVDIENLPDKELYNLAHKSDNEAASRVLDLVTGTTSGGDLNPEFLGIWDAQRKWVNRFFEQAGYQSLNVSQKNFPIPFLGLDSPEGRELQMRGGDTSTPFRNYMTTHDAARLMYEIASFQAVSPAASQEMLQLLTQDLHPDAWKPVQYNSVEGFLGEYLPADTRFIAKVGWTSQSRQEVAFVTSPDGQTQYVVAIFGDDRAYADDWEIFPEISRILYDEMLSR